MLVYTIDDERIALEALTCAVREALPDAEVRSFARGAQALKAMRDEGQRPELIFSDIRMPGVDGLELAARVKIISPDTVVIFVTGYSAYALNAFKVHADGYLMKPVLAEHIREEIGHLRSRLPEPGDRLYVQCFGSFEVFWDSKPLTFKRKKSKELFAFLIDRAGASASAEEAIAVLWEDADDIGKAKHNLRNLVNDLRSALSKVGMEDILIRGRGTMAVDRPRVDCDYYRMLDGDMHAVNSFRGEYMKQYSWAEITLANLYFRE